MFNGGDVQVACENKSEEITIDVWNNIQTYSLTFPHLNIYVLMIQILLKNILMPFGVACCIFPLKTKNREFQTETDMPF